jgi:hypothetical protein
LRVRDDLKKNPNASPSATAQLDENATGVINAIPSAKRDFESVIAKAKASAVWSRADAVFEQNVEKSDLNLKQKSQLVLLVKRRGGVKAVLENTLRELDHLANEIGQEVAIIRRKHSEFLHFELISPSYATLSHNQCLVLLGVATAHFVIGFYHVAGVLVAAGIFECV